MQIKQSRELVKLKRKNRHSKTPVPVRAHKLKPLVSFMLEKGMFASGLMATQLLLAPLAAAAPEGGVVVSGQGSINQVSPLKTHIAQQSQNPYYFGMNVQLVRDGSGQSALQVVRVTPGGPAQFAGLEPGDHILTQNGQNFSPAP